MRRYAPDTAEYVYDQPRHPSGSKGVLLQRTKTVVAGDHLDADIYPVLDWQYSREVRAQRKTPEQMARANKARSFRTLVQLLNANFTDGDFKCDLSCAYDCEYEQFVKIKNNFIARLRRAYRKAGGELRCVGIIESTHEGMHHHIHMVCNGGVISRDQVEKIWRQGTANVDRVQTQFEDKGLEAFARYITRHKDTQEKLMHRGWFASKGLKKPRTTYNDSKFSRAAAARIEKAVREDARREFEKRYPGWRLVDYSVHYSEFLPGVYIHAHMRRR